ncbi:MAG: YtxH domain-containing protein [Caldicoprobacterales bacterium]|jgi:gas vesicle protein|nr:YtxH domain-containing protein [Clostridiales bacterium]
MNKSFRTFIAGGLLGIAAGMILLPQLEPETRKKIIGKGKNIIEDAAQMMPGKNGQGI